MALLGDDSDGEGEEEVGDGRDFLLTDDAKDIDLRYELDTSLHCLSLVALESYTPCLTRSKPVEKHQTCCRCKCVSTVQLWWHSYFSIYYPVWHDYSYHFTT